MKTYPVYEKHEDARCFNCDGPLHDPRPASYGTSQQQAECPRCKVPTWYDLAAEVQSKLGPDERAELYYWWEGFILGCCLMGALIFILTIASVLRGG